MKKTTLLRKTAYLVPPQIADGFVPPANFDYKISVSLHEVDIKIYGFTGTSWELMHNSDGVIASFETEVQHQKYYFESKSGEEQTVRVSFLSTADREGLNIRTGVTPETRRFYDIEEIPVYNGSRDGAMLTVMSNGSLAWLLASESFTIAAPTFTPSGVGTFLEELTMFGAGTLADGTLSTTTGSPSYYKKSGMPVVSTTATTAVFSMWFNPTQAKMGLYSDMHVASQVTFGLRMFNTGLLHISTPIGTTDGITLATPLTLNEWHHALVTVETDVAYTSTSSKSMTVKLFIDGQEVYTKTGNSSTKRIRAYAGISNGTTHYIGAQNYNGTVDYKGVGQFDFMEWVDDVTLSDAQILAMYNGGTRGWSVADGSAYVAPAAPGPSYLESSATLSGDANLSNGSLVLDGTGDYAVIDDGFRFTDKMTTSVWFKTSATGDRRIYSSHVRSMGGADYRNGFFARLNSGQLKYRHPAGGTGELTGPSGLNDGAWHHLALSWEAGVGYVLYVDGVQRGQGSSGASDGYAAGWGLYIGANPWNNNNPYALFDGEIKKFEVLNEVLTAQQVTDRFNEG
jgi:hypothetical protein